ncbi:hypothetical protein [Endozoicomonas sp. SCSIO W0465]|uniref:hypothetical protein n=1 Tax=Endozoicomonas sp. SCSIO W0465 TaxID=2918516 RepID=UPI0020759DD0|nr:hypothetical protein [Endozoicomonas sp. SCSIO W0465]USE37171.1 hypothetical protein MJO57_02770 [Endozoicomonas sp. SCSIO W0465]
MRMNLESRVEKLEMGQEALNHAFRDLANVVSATHEVVALILKEQQDTRKELNEFKGEVKAQFRQIDQRFDQQDKRFDKIEEILIQIIGRLPDQPAI